MGINRREFLKRAGLTGGTLAAAAALPACHTAFPVGYQPSTKTMLEGLPSDSPVDTVVIVMMENRSFDHWLGWLGTDTGYWDAGRRRYGSHFWINANNQQTYSGPAGPESTHHMIGWDYLTNPFRGCDQSDPNHGWNAGRAQRDLGFVAPSANDDLLPLGYYEGADLPFTQRLAKRFTVFDDYHASLLGPTFPNREYLHSAQSGLNKSNTFPTGPDGFEWPTIWDRLGAANVPAKYYGSDLPFVLLWGSRMAPFNHTLDDFYADCAAGTLPNVVMVDPAFTGENENDDHPLADVRAGQAFLRSIFKAFASSPQWQRGAFIVTYDEWGGWFDHVAPPHLADDHASADDQEDFSQAGFRVPTVLASPYARKGMVDDRTYDHTSILRFLEWRFLGAPPEGPGSPGDSWYLTRRDQYANNIGATLSSKVVDMDLEFDIDMTIDPPSAACGSGVSGLSTMQRSVLEANDPAFDEGRWSTYLDSVGHPLG
ncbi:MAG: alkaline phosphatase family protein [Acidimicrobiia bacterium]